MTFVSLNIARQARSAGLAFVLLGLLRGSAADLPLEMEPPTFALTTTNFIEFIKTPPAISTLILKRTVLDRPRMFKSQKDWEAFIKEFKAGKIPANNRLEELFALRHLSSKEFVFQQINDPTNAWSKTTRLATFSGKGNGVWWTLGQNGAISTDSTNGIYKTDERDNLTFLVQYQLATEVLRLGMFDLNPETLEEAAAVDGAGTDVGFTARTLLGETLTGTASATGGVIDRIKYMIAQPSGSLQGRLIEITHTNQRLSSILVNNFIKGQPAPVAYCSFRILHIAVPVSPIASNLCMVDQFLAASDANVLVKDSGEMFNLKRNPTVPLPKRPNTKPVVTANSKKALLVGVFGIILIVPLLLFYYAKKKDRQEADLMNLPPPKQT
jgi:hypothetical protein